MPRSARLPWDEYKDLVAEVTRIVDESPQEISIKKKTRKELGRILLKGDNITLMMNTGT